MVTTYLEQCCVTMWSYNSGALLLHPSPSVHAKIVVLKGWCLAVLTILLILHAQYDLWGAVVSGDHVGGHHEVSAGRPRQAKIQDL